MSELYENFEKRFTNSWFNSGWIEVEVKPAENQIVHKDLSVLEAELEVINNQLESIEHNQLRLANLAKLYN